MSDLLEEFRKSYEETVDPKNLRVLLSLQVITKDTERQAAVNAWWDLVHDPVIAEREATDPSPQQYCDRFVKYGMAPRRLIRYDVIRKIVAEMSDDEKFMLRTRLLDRRVKKMTPASAPKAPPAGTLLI